MCDHTFYCAREGIKHSVMEEGKSLSPAYETVGENDLQLF